MKEEFHVLTNGQQDLSTVLPIIKTISPFVTAIHIREKHRTVNEIEHWVQRLIEEGIPRNKLVLNSHVELAADYKLAGVHLPTHHGNPYQIKKRFPFLRVGVSIHNQEEALTYNEGVDYLFFGNVFETSCKPGLQGKGLTQLESILRLVNVPVIALGGIIPERMPDLVKLGVAGVAVMSGVMEADVPLQAVNGYSHQLNERSSKNETQTI